MAFVQDSINPTPAYRCSNDSGTPVISDGGRGRFASAATVTALTETGRSAAATSGQPRSSSSTVSVRN